MRLFAPKRISLLPLLLVLALPPGAARAQKAEEPPLITVTGQAEVNVAPDEVIFTLVVAKTDKDLQTAKRLNDESVRQILALARRFNVAPQDVKTDYISVDMQYNTDLIEDDSDARARKVKREFVGYQVSKTVIVRFTDLPRFEDLFSETLKAGVSSIREVDFRNSQVRKHKDEARALAIRAAKEKAEALTKEIGQSIGRAYSIQEGAFRDNTSPNNFTTRISGNFSADENSTIAPGLISVTAQVTVSFILQ